MLMPFSGPQGQQFSDFEECVNSMQDEEGIGDAEGLCAVWMRQAKKLSDEYETEELLAIKQDLDLDEMEFLSALKLLEQHGDLDQKADASDLSVGDWVEWQTADDRVVGQISGEGKEERVEEGQRFDGREGVADVFRIDVWDDEAEQLDESVIHPASELSLTDEPDDFESKAEIADKYVSERNEAFFVPNDTVAEEAQQALDWREEHPDEIAGGSDADGEGWRRAQQLVDYNSDDEPLAIEFWEEIDAFHSRHHAQDNHELGDDLQGEPWMDAGYVSHLTWGGDPGFDQAQSVTELVEEVDD